MHRYTILWADDEIELLKPYIVFLEGKGYDITPVPSGADAIDKVETQNFDLIFLDEMMAGMTGIETLAQIKQMKPNIPVIMITKSEEEHIMEDAIGSKIADYLIKPINPNQILMSVKKILDKKRLVSEKTNTGYQVDFRNLAMQYNDNLDYDEWADIYKKLVYWELELEKSKDHSMEEVFEMQKAEANSNFCKFVSDNYEDWMSNADADRPLLSQNIMKQAVLPHLKEDSPLYLIIIDNFRLDQWRLMQEVINDLFETKEDNTYYSILPTATSYARNAIFSGMTPYDMEKYHGDLWVTDEGNNEDGLNKNEEEFFKRFLKKNKKDINFSYSKIINNNHGKSIVSNFNNNIKNDLNIVVYNFVDMLSHARTELNLIKELAPDESAYRSITRSWIEHSPILDYLKLISENKGRVIITTDHGMVKVKNAKKIVGDRNTNTNLRYKQGRNLNLQGKESGVISTRDPKSFGLPSPNMSTSYFFTTEDNFFAYPNNFNHYVGHFKDTFQHGGVSLEEMIIPIAYLEAK